MTKDVDGTLDGGIELDAFDFCFNLRNGVCDPFGLEADTGKQSNLSLQH